MIRGTDIEFRHRSWFIALIYIIAFWSYKIESIDVVHWLLRALAHRGALSGISFRTAAQVIFGLGALITGAAAIARTWGTAYLRNDVVRDSALHADQVLADGPYRYVRNPLYIGTVLLAIGLSVMAPPIGWVVLVAGMAFFTLRLIGCEEAFLLEKQGDSYRAYFERVPRLWPALRPRVPSGGVEPRWGQAWLGESWIWVIFIGQAVFALTLKIRLFDYFVWSGLGIYLLLRVLVRHQAQRRYS